MARKKVNLQWIANDSTRRATFKKRRRGLMKKASELATLCDVEVSVVVYGPGDPHPEVWPSLPEATRVLARFKSMPELEQCKKMMNQEGFLRQRVAKLQEQLRKQERENRELEIALLMRDAIAGRRPGLAGVSIEDVTSLGWMVEMRLKTVKDRVDHLRSQAPPPPPPHPLPNATHHNDAAAAAASAMHAAMHADMVPGMKEIKTQLEASMEAAHRQSWFMEVVNASDGMFYNGFSGCSVNNVGGGAGEEMMHLCMDAGFSWSDPSFPPM